jgi:hypothetical protein
MGAALTVPKVKPVLAVLAALVRVDVGKENVISVLG